MTGVDGIDLERHPECRDLPLVVYLAGRFCRRYGGRTAGVEVADLVQAGYLVLRQCHAGYDPAVGCPYKVYLTRALVNTFVRLLRNNRPVREKLNSASWEGARLRARERQENRVSYRTLYDEMSMLPAVQSEALRLNYGLDGDALSHEEIGRRGLLDRKCGRSRVRQIVADGLNRLRDRLS